jgi:hypothetical protein
MTRTDTIRDSTTVWVKRLRASPRGSPEGSARIEQMTREERLRVRKVLAQSGSAVPGLYLG